MWANDIDAAQTAHIDAFALNLATKDPWQKVIPAAFAAAESKGFHLFFSFDYAASDKGYWPKQQVTQLINQYKGSSAYFHHGGPFVSTFEGPDYADEWTDIKTDTGCFFIPDWSSKGAKAALEPGTADGLFSWAAWPWGNEDMNTYVDASYYQYLNGSPYMMPASPWFYTNLPGYKKNWMWR